MSDNNKRLIIIGGGAAGLLIAMKLAPDKEKLGLDITLIDCKSFFEYTPGLISVLFEKTDEKFEQHFSSITADYEAILSPIGVRFILGHVQDIADSIVILGDDQRHEVPFDILAICTGSYYRDLWKVRCQQGSPRFMDRQQRLDYLRQQRSRYKAAKSILCIGGGPVGVEVATEIAYRAPSKQVTIVNSSNAPLPGTPADLSRSASRVLSHLKPVRIISGERAEQKEDGIYVTDKTQQEIKADLVYVCTGIKPNTGYLQESHVEWLDDAQHIRVDSFLRVKGACQPNIFAIGDVNDFKEPKLFFTAHMQAMHFVRNVHSLVQGNRQLEPYRGSQISMVISLGPHYATAVLAGLLMDGWPFSRNKGSKLASLAKFVVERMTMDDFGSKKFANDMLYRIHEKGHVIAKLIGHLG